MINNAGASSSCKIIQEHIRNFDLDKALEEFKNLENVIEDKHKNSIIIYSARYNRVMNSKRNGSMSSESVDLALNKLMDDILQFLRTLDFQNTLEANHQKMDELEVAISKIGAQLSLNVDIAKERINKLGECWSEMYSFENKLFKVVDKFINCLLSKNTIGSDLDQLYINFKNNKKLDNLYNLLSSQELIKIIGEDSISEEVHEVLLQEMEIAYRDYEEADFVLEKNKFWLGYDIYDEARKYHDCYPRFLEQYKDKKYNGCLTCLKYQKDAKGSIEKIIKHFQSQIF